MKMIILLIGTALLSFGAPAAKNDAPKMICDLFQDKPQFKYSEIFDSSIADFLPEEEFRSTLQDRYSNLGACLKWTQVRQSEEVTAYDLQFKHGRHIDLFLSVNSKGLINRFYLGNELPSSDQVVTEEVMVPMRDGVKLRTIIFRKKNSLKQPVLLMRTPYLRFIYGMTPFSRFYGRFAKHYVENGYTYAIQGIRGTGGSEGTFKEFLAQQEATDGFDAVEWLAKQEYSTGKIAMIGGSYDGYTAIAAATENPPHLKVVIAGSYPWSAGQYSGFQNVRPSFDLLWLYYVSMGSGIPPHDSKFSPEITAKLLPIADFRKYDSLVFGVTIPEWQLLCQFSPDPEASFWQERSLQSRFAKIKIPTYHLAGMLDEQSIDTINGFNHIQKNNLQKGLHHLIIGYWPHAVLPQYVSYLVEPVDRWLAHYLKGSALAPQRVVKMVIEADPDSKKFIESDQYPLPQLRSQILYFDQNELSVKKPKKINRISIKTDPHEDNTQIAESLAPSPQTTALFKKKITKAMLLTGDIDLKLTVSTDSPQTDVLIMVRKFDLSGKVKTLGQTMAKTMRHRSSSQLSLKIGPILEKIEAGETLQVLVSGNYFPFVIRNTNSPTTNYFNQINPSTISVETGGPNPSFIKFTFQ